MKNKYFGDLKDLFKYDLMLAVCQGCGINKVTFIPMLTKDDSKKEGLDTNYIKARAEGRPGTENKELMHFLMRKILLEDRHVRHIEDYFAGENIGMYIHCKETTDFSNANRADYFKTVLRKCSADSLIFLDPDNGLEVSKPTHKHVLFSEVIEIYKAMKATSILMIIQFFPRQNHKKYISARRKELSKRTASNVAYIADSKIVFFFLTQNASLLMKIKSTLNRYCNKYQGTTYWGCE